MKRMLLVIFVAGLVSSAEVFGQPEVKGRGDTSRITGETVTLRKGESFRRRATGGVEVIDIATGRTNITVECLCDPDGSPPGGPSGSCDEEIVDEKVRCKPTGCQDCDMHRTGGFKGDDKLQTESPTTGGAFRPESGGTDEAKNWTITPNSSLTGAIGRMVVDLPKGTKYVVKIFKSGDSNQALGESSFKSASLLPGLYDVIINTGASVAKSPWRLRGVPVESGKDTRLHAGVLNITATGMWHVYDEAREVMIVGGHGPSRIGLLAGRYQVKVANDFRPIVIQDGQVTDF